MRAREFITDITQYGKFPDSVYNPEWVYSQTVDGAEIISRIDSEMCITKKRIKL